MTDGNRIYFIEGSGANYRLAQVSVAGGEVAVINSGTSLPYLSSISSDGSELLGTVGAFTPAEEIWAFPVPAGSPRRIGDLIGRSPAWAPDGKIFFGKGNEIWIAEHDGSFPRKLVTTRGYPAGFQFSPDGIHFRFSVPRQRKWDSLRPEVKLHI